MNAYLGLDQIFGKDLPGNQEFRQTVGHALEKLLEDGAARTVAGMTS